MLEVKDLYAGYDAGNVLQGISIDINNGEIVALIGRNGVGKTTCIKTIMGELPVRKGEIFFRKKKSDL